MTSSPSNGDCVAPSDPLDRIIAEVARGPRVPLITAPSLHPGDVVGEQYEVVQRLGVGGMGEVFLAEDLPLGRTVVVKLVRAFVHDEEKQKKLVRRFEREARATAALRHPNIVSIYALGEWQGAPYMVLEHLRGSNLRQRLATGPMPVGQAIDIATDVAQALAHAHAQGAVHRDLKPENIVLDAEGTKVLDFGLAQLTSGLRERFSRSDDQVAHWSTTPGGGTPGYMAPEQWNEEPQDARTDIWALGAVIFEMLAGRRPFATPLAMLKAKDEDITLLLPPLVPMCVREVAGRALAYDPADRYQSASALVDALESARASLGPEDLVTLTSDGPSERALAGGLAPTEEDPTLVPSLFTDTPEETPSDTVDEVDAASPRPALAPTKTELSRVEVPAQPDADTLLRTMAGYWDAAGRPRGLLASGPVLLEAAGAEAATNDLVVRAFVEASHRRQRALRIAVVLGVVLTLLAFALTR